MLVRLLFVIVLVIASAGPASARRKKPTHTPPPTPHKQSDAEIEAATRLQVFLDRANFSPGKIDGHYSDFTLKALALYHQSRGEPASPRPPKADTAPDLNGIDLGSVGPVFIQYTVTEADLQNVGPLPNGEPTAAAKTSVKVDVKTNMLGVFEGDKIVAAYPVTVGSAQTATPIGEWNVRGVAKLPSFRYDEHMLKRGERSKNFHMLPPGPNSPVGVVWIALNKRGVGIHGTDEPNTIGQAVSHGCIRLANWDIVRLAGRVKAGVPVSVH